MGPKGSFLFSLKKGIATPFLSSSEYAISFTGSSTLPESLQGILETAKAKHGHLGNFSVKFLDNYVQYKQSSGHNSELPEVQKQVSILISHSLGLSLCTE